MLSIRRMAATDLPSVQCLLSQLGYDIGMDEAEQRFRSVADAEGHAVMVGVRDARIAALLHVYARPALEKPPQAVVQALVVDRSCRGMGIGRALMEVAEAWARVNGFASMALSSSVTRGDAHAFYRALGYAQKATSYLLGKRL